MKRLATCAAFVACVFVIVAEPARAQEAGDILGKDLAGASDHPLVGRYSGSVILARTQKAFDEIKLPSGKAEGATYSDEKKFTSMLTAQGTVTRAIYVAPEGRSSFEVAANFVESVTAKGFQPVFQCSGEDCGESFYLLKYRWDNKASKVVGANYENVRGLLVEAVFDEVIDVRYSLLKKSAPEGDTYVAIYTALNQGGTFGDFSRALSGRPAVLLEIVEPRVMDRSMEVVTAAAIGTDIARQGRVVFYGVQFDFDKAAIKPESEPQLAEMASFLKTNAGLRAYVIGHTDNKGALDYNVNLSNRRAEAVVKALSGKYGIDAKRLAPRGLGPLAPVASNRSEDGQAKNRRVELVEQ